MKISGFTFCRNTSKLYYPVKESILSVLPIVDEFIIALGDGDEDDTTEELIKSIASEKIKIVYTKWDLNKYTNGTEYAHQTDLAKEACSGDWLFYIQGDEVVHEKHLPLIKEHCEKYLDDKEVDGFLFKYRHFWGDYDHYIVSHAWYPREIRIIRNDPEIHSWRDAQSFRRIPDFDGINYNQKENTYKLQVIELDAYINHYGFVRPPEVMQKKRKNHNSNYRGEESTQQRFKNQGSSFDYGDLSKLQTFTESHPAVMHDFMKKFNWKDQLRYKSDPAIKQVLKHEKLKYRLLTWFEHTFFGGKIVFGFKNYKIIKR